MTFKNKNISIVPLKHGVLLKEAYKSKRVRHSVKVKQITAKNRIPLIKRELKKGQKFTKFRQRYCHNPSSKGFIVLKPFGDEISKPTITEHRANNNIKSKKIQIDLPISNIQYFNRSELSSSLDDKISVISKCKPSFYNHKILTCGRNAERYFHTICEANYKMNSELGNFQLNTEINNILNTNDSDKGANFTFASPLSNEKVLQQINK